MTKWVSVSDVYLLWGSEGWVQFVSTRLCGCETSVRFSCETQFSMVAPSGLRAVAAGAPSNFRVFPEADGGHAVVGRRLGVHVPENQDVEMRLPSDDVMQYYANVGVTFVDWSPEVGEGLD